MRYRLKSCTGSILVDENNKTVFKTLKGWRAWGKQFTNKYFKEIHVSLWKASDDNASKNYDYVTVNISNSQTY